MRANFQESLEKLFNLEFSNPSNALHKNKGEDGVTYKGIYQTAHPHWKGWDIVKEYLNAYENVKDASEALFNNSLVDMLVEDFYKETFWDRAKLDYVYSQKKCDEIFIFGVNVGMRTAIRKTQKLVGVTPDGIIGSQSLKAINEFNEDTFDMKFDEIEIKYYEDIIENKPSFAIFRNGWENRAVAV